MCKWAKLDTTADEPTNICRLMLAKERCPDALVSATGLTLVAILAKALPLSDLVNFLRRVTSLVAEGSGQHDDLYFRRAFSSLSLAIVVGRQKEIEDLSALVTALVVADSSAALAVVKGLMATNVDEKKRPILAGLLEEALQDCDQNEDDVLELLILVKALKDPQSAFEELRARMKAFLERGRPFSILVNLRQRELVSASTVADYLMATMDIERMQDMTLILRRSHSVLEEGAKDAFLAAVRRNLHLLLARGDDGRVESQCLHALLDAYVRCDQYENEDWPLLTSLAARGPVDCRVHVLDVLKKVVKRVNRTRISELFSDLWPLAVNQHWGVVEALLDLLGHYEPKEDPMLANVLKATLGHFESHVRAAAVQLASTSCEASMREDSILRSLMLDEEAVVRRAAVRAAMDLPSTRRMLSALAIVAGDEDAETRELVIPFWRERVEELALLKFLDEPERLWSKLSESTVAHWLALALTECERTVLAKLRPVMQTLGPVFRALSRDVEPPSAKRARLEPDAVASTDDEEREDGLDEVIAAKDVKAVKAGQKEGFHSCYYKGRRAPEVISLPKVTPQTLIVAYDRWTSRVSQATDLLEEHKELNLGLKAILEDILAAESDDGQRLMDGLDCV